MKQKSSISQFLNPPISNKFLSLTMTVNHFEMCKKIQTKMKNS